MQVRLERDEVVIAYDASALDEDALLATIKGAGYGANIVTDVPRPRSGTDPSPPVEDPPILSKALSRARRERKPLVLDFHAGWCVPCRRLLEETFPDPKVAALLGR